MSKTPICDFVQAYARRDAVRLHMPGHKGVPLLGCEALDITEIDGADNLYAPGGIIAESERYASAHFGCPTYYSAEGSSLCIRAMLALAQQLTGRSLVLAGRNAHKVFVYAAALLDLSVQWLHPKTTDTYYSCTLTSQDVEQAIRLYRPCAVYLTSPDYLGNIADVAAISEVCHRHGVLLLVDNAHGAYLRFLPQPQHPMDLGADLCCDSAHKTLPVLTGGAYLHISARLPISDPAVRDAMALFGSTSPSYLILQSLDRANLYLDTYRETLSGFLPKAEALRRSLENHGYLCTGGEPLKLSVFVKPFGYTGDALAAVLERAHIYPELHDADCVVLMLTPELSSASLERVQHVLLSLPCRQPITDMPPEYSRPRAVLSLRKACMAAKETVPVAECVGRVMASASVMCPPAIPIVQCGEEIDEAAAERLRYYGVESCSVVRKEFTES